MSITFGKYTFFVIMIVRFIIHLVYISLKLVRDKRVELLALAESKRCSTTELITHGVKEEDRTPDMRYHKPPLYH